MSSVNWETVGNDGKAIKKVGVGKVDAKKEAAAKKKFQEKAPKLQDFLPYDDVASLYSSFDKPRSQNGTGSGSGSASASGTGSPVKAKKVQQEHKKVEKRETVAVQSKPRTLEEASKKISVANLKHLLMDTRAAFPSDPLLWIRDAAAHFNIVMSLSNNELQSTDFDCFSQKHLSILNKETKILLIRLIEEVGESTRVSAFETFMANMCHDMAKNNCVSGYLIFLQLLAELHPSLCLLHGANNRFAELRNSYQNRANIGTALLWSVGLGGSKDLAIGLKVFIDFMLPLLSLRNFSRFIVEYLKNLFSVHEATSAKSVLKTADGSRVLYPLQFFTAFDAIFFNAPSGLSKDIQATLLSQYRILKNLSIGNCSIDHELFPEFLRRLDVVVSSTDRPSARAEILACLVECLVGDCSSAAIVHWQQMYRAHYVASALLLKYLESNWVSDVSKRIGNDSELEDLIFAFHDYNVTCLPSKEGAVMATSSTKLLLKKMANSTTTSGWFPWKTLTLLMLISTAYIVHRDVVKKGTFQASNTGKFLQDVGLFDETVKYYHVANYIFEDVRDWTRESLPLHLAALKKATGPALAKAEEAFNYVSKNVHKASIQIIDKANEYLPGIREKAVLVYSNALETITFIIEKIRLEGPVYFESFVKIATEVCAEGAQLAKKGAFAVVQCVKDIYDGKIDLTDVKNAAVDAFKTTKLYANDLYEKLILKTK